MGGFLLLLHFGCKSVVLMDGKKISEAGKVDVPPNSWDQSSLSSHRTHREDGLRVWSGEDPTESTP